MTYSSDRRQSAAGVAQSVARNAGAASFIDQRSSTAAQMQLKQKIDGSQSVGAASPVTQLMPEEEEPLQGKFEAAQRQAFDEEEEPVQAKFAGSGAAQLAENEEARPNNTGLPDNLKSGIENLSGMSMDHVKVHYNSAQPAQLNAHAYAQGSEIHIAPGQERHLPHEAWHVVQQAQGRVRPTVQMKASAVNDDLSLENEADMMGERAVQFEGGHDVRNLVPEERLAGVATQCVTSTKPLLFENGQQGSCEYGMPSKLVHQSNSVSQLKKLQGIADPKHAVVQLITITTHDSKAGGGESLNINTGDEVQQILRENIQADVTAAAAVLRNSIRLREIEQGIFMDHKAPAWHRHKARLRQERAWLTSLETRVADYAAANQDINAAVAAAQAPPPPPGGNQPLGPPRW